MDPQVDWDDSRLGAVFVGGDRQPGTVGTPPNDAFDGTNPNSKGALQATGRNFRVDLFGDSNATLKSNTFSDMTHYTAQVAEVIHAVESFQIGTPFVVTAPGHGLQNGDRVVLSSLRFSHDSVNFIQAPIVRTVSVIDPSHFSVRLITPDTYLGGGIFYRYDSGSARPSGSRDMTFDAAGNLIEVDDGGIYMRTNPSGPLGDWRPLIGNLQITEFHKIDYDHNFDLVFGSAFNLGVSRHRASDSPA